MADFSPDRALAAAPAARRNISESNFSLQAPTPVATIVFSPSGNLITSSGLAAKRKRSKTLAKLLVSVPFTLPRTSN